MLEFALNVIRIAASFFSGKWEQFKNYPWETLAQENDRKGRLVLGEMPAVDAKTIFQGLLEIFAAKCEMPDLRNS